MRDANRKCPLKIYQSATSRARAIESSLAIIQQSWLCVRAKLHCPPLIDITLAIALELSEVFGAMRSWRPYNTAWWYTDALRSTDRARSQPTSTNCSWRSNTYFMRAMIDEDRARIYCARFRWIAAARGYSINKQSANKFDSCVCVLIATSNYIDRVWESDENGRGGGELLPERSADGMGCLWTDDPKSDSCVARGSWCGNGAVRSVQPNTIESPREMCDGIMQ